MKLKEYKLVNWKEGKIKRQKKLSDKNILLLSIDGSSPKEGTKNLLAIDKDSNILWVAALPTDVYDSYYDMKFENGIVYGRSSNSFVAEIDSETGNILKSYLVK